MKIQTQMSVMCGVIDGNTIGMINCLLVIDREDTEIDILIWNASLGFRSVFYVVDGQETVLPERLQKLISSQTRVYLTIRVIKELLTRICIK